jgi:hypothetical protein
MSSMYNMLFGERSSHQDFLLKLLDSETGDFCRYRAIYVTDEHIVVHTRCGGGNREEYFPDWVEDHPLYSHDEDGDFDSTYADIYFHHPEEYKEILKEMAEGTITPSEKWKMLFEALGK